MTLFEALPPQMLDAQRWLVHRAKVPHCVSGKRRGKTDTPEDLAALGSIDDAVRACCDGNYDGIGFALGDGWQGVDLDKCRDPSTGKLAQPAAQIVEQTETYTEVSPSGRGLHLIGFGPSFPAFKNVTPQGGIECYSGGRFFTVTGQCLQGAGTLSDVSPVVEQLRAKFGQRKAAVDAPQADAIPNGQRNNELTSIAGMLRARGYTAEAIESALLSINQALCASPLPEREVRQIANSVARYEAGNFEEVEGFATSLVVNAHDFLKLDVPPREWIIDGVLATSSLAMIFGWRGLGKTYLAMHLAVAIASGEPFLEWDVVSRRSVLYIDGELPAADMQQRVRAAVGTRTDVRLYVWSSELAYHEEEGGLFINNVVDQHRLLVTLGALETEGRRPEVLIFDNLSAMTRGADENSNSELDTLLAFLMGLRHRGYTVILIHHAGKGGDQRGASRREDLLDLVIKLNKPEMPSTSGNAKFTLQFEKLRGARQPQPLECELVTDAHGYPVWTTRPLGGTGAKPIWLLVLKFIADKRPAQQKEIATAFNVKHSATVEHIKRLRTKGLLNPDSMTPTKRGLQYLASAFNNDAEDENAPEF